MNADTILKLNKNFFPIDTADWQSVIRDIFSGAVYPLDIYYEENEDGTFNTNKIEYFNIVKSLKEWFELPVRSYDTFVSSSKQKVRLPTIVITTQFGDVPYNKAIFPTRTNILKRDNYTCGYSGEKLTKEQATVDHIIPKSRGGKNTWENLITCDKTINRIKGDKTPAEAKMRLLWTPKRPANNSVIEYLKDEWQMFLDGGTYENT